MVVGDNLFTCHRYSRAPISGADRSHRLKCSERDVSSMVNMEGRLGKNECVFEANIVGTNLYVMYFTKNPFP